jgi:hypothetical protein
MEEQTKHPVGNHSIEWVHAKLEKHMRLVEGYSNIKGLAWILKACRMRPFDYVVSYQNTIVLHNQWQDEFGNLLTIDKDRKVVITYQDLRLLGKTSCTDLYYGLSIEKVIKISRQVMVVYGKDEDLLEDCALLIFLGLDEHYRAYLQWHGEWSQVSPLLVGVPTLRFMAKHAKDRGFFPYRKKENTIAPCVRGGALLTSLPTTGRPFAKVLGKKRSELLEFLRGAG